MALRWSIYAPDRFAAINADSAVPPCELDLPMLTNLKPMPVFLRHDAAHTGTPLKEVKAFETQAKKVDVNLCLVGLGANGDEDNRKVEAFQTSLSGARRDLYARQLEFASNDPQVNRRAWLRIDEYDNRNNPNFEMRLHQPNGKEKGAVIETKKLHLYPATIDAKIEENTIQIKTSRVGSLTVFLSRCMFDQEKAVVIIANKQTICSKKFAPTLEFMLEEARRSGRRDRVYATAYSFRVR